jgi:hypothetical protein
MKNGRAGLIVREAALLVINELRQTALDDVDPGAFVALLLQRSRPRGIRSDSQRGRTCRSWLGQRVFPWVW